MARRQIGIRVKLIGVSTVLLIVVVGLFGWVNGVQSRRIIDHFSRMLKTKVTDSLRQSGEAQLALLAEVSRLAMLQNDYTMLQTTARNLGRQPLVSVAAMVDPAGVILAHSDPKRAGKPATGLLARGIAPGQAAVLERAEFDGKRVIAFGKAVMARKRMLCRVFLAYSLAPLEQELVNTAELKRREVTASLRNTLALGLLAVLLGVLLTIIQSIRLTRPIHALASQADRMASGDLEARVAVESQDEIGLLGERFNFMAEQMMVLLRETLAKATMEKELEVASAIQSTLVPGASIAELPGLQVAGYFCPATHCGGDWWSYHSLSGDRTLMLVGDVTGHGVGAAMITAAAQGAVTTMLEVTGGDVDLPALLRAMNVAVHAAARGKFVMTCFASIYDPHEGSLRFANAGHNFPYHYQAAHGDLSTLVIRGNRLGDLLGSDFDTGHVQVREGDMLLWYTDGIVECENIRGEELGERRLRAELIRHADFPPDQALELIVKRAKEFFGEVPQKDDITLVLGRISRQGAA